MVNGSVRLIEVTEEEAFKGGMPWDMNPLIFIRAKRPLVRP